MTSKGRFFAIDRRAWARACELGLNVAVVYLVLARGTLRDQRTTSWSVNSIEQYTGVSRPRAQAAIKMLVDAGLVRNIRLGSRPCYRLTPAHEVPQCEGAPACLSAEEETVRALVAAGDHWVPKTARVSSRWSTGKPHDIALGLVRKGVLRHRGNQSFEILPAKPDASEPDWIWLPNSLVDGVSGEMPPLERVRQLQDVGALRLFIDLYHAHALASDGGLHWQLIRRSYKREKLGEIGRLILWRFEEDEDLLWFKGPFARFLTGRRDKDGRDEGAPILWKIWEALKRTGLIECVPHLIEADTDEAEVVHPCPIDTGTPVEQALGNAARAAAGSLASAITTAILSERGGDLIPIPDSIPHVQMVGIYRLRYRPHTRATGAWFAQRDNWKRMAEQYQTMASEAAAGLPVKIFPTGLQHQGKSRDDQRSSMGSYLSR